MSDVTVGDKFGNWKIIELKGNGYARCECQCENHTIKDIKTYTLVKGTSKSCGCLRKRIASNARLLDLVGQHFGEWTVLEYSGNSMWKCSCSCGMIKNVKAQSLKNGASTSCGHDTTKFNDLSGKKINHWEILEYVGDNHYKCRCDCVNHTIKIVSRPNLVTGASKSCGCGHKKVKLMDITGKRFGKLVAEKYLENGFWQCKCTVCGRISIHNSQNLRKNAENFSCEYCDNNTKTIEDIINAIKEFEKINSRKPFRSELATALGIGITTVNRYVEKYNLYEHLNKKYRSLAEMELHTIFSEAHINNRTALKNGQEIDLYMSEQRIGIELNGGYWHSDIFKDKNYHQNKRLLAEKLGIHLINIYEYEWNNPEYKNKIINYIKSIISNNSKILYARNTHIKEIDNQSAKEFEERYHLQGGINSEINVGLHVDNKLIGLMSFSKSRFDKSYDYEITRLVFKDDIKIVGGSERLFSYFIDRYNPKNIVSYCSLDVFTGEVYSKLGMQLDSITEPGYVWWNCKLNSNSSVLSRYKTTKSNLIKLGYGSLGDTEDEIMANLGYYKIYNCGNKKFIWNS